MHGSEGGQLWMQQSIAAMFDEYKIGVFVSSVPIVEQNHDRHEAFNNSDTFLDYPDEA